MNLSSTLSKNHCIARLKWEKSTPYVSDSVVKCRYCAGYCIKNGKEKNGQQRFKCKSCKKNQQAIYQYNACTTALDNPIIALTKEGVGIRGTARLLGISPTTLISRIKKIAAEIKEPALVKGKTYEVDELRTFVKKKTSNLGGECLSKRNREDCSF